MTMIRRLLLTTVILGAWAVGLTLATMPILTHPAEAVSCPNDVCT